MACYILNPRYRLRGWEKLPFALFDAATRKADFYQKPQFQLLMRCDGIQGIDLDSLPEDLRLWLAQLEADGIIAPSSPGDLLLP